MKYIPSDLERKKERVYLMHKAKYLNYWSKKQILKDLS